MRLVAASLVAIIIYERRKRYAPDTDYYTYFHDKLVQKLSKPILKFSIFELKSLACSMSFMSLLFWLSAEVENNTIWCIALSIHLSYNWPLKETLLYNELILCTDNKNFRPKLKV